MKKGTVLALLLCLFIFTDKAHAEGYYTKGNEIYDETGQKMMWNGLNWFGFETHNNVLHGLWSRNLDDMLDQAKAQGYNLIRVPYSNDLFKASAQVNSVDFYKNPELQNKTPLQVLDILIEKAAARDMYILLDRHRPDANAQSELWYTASVSEAKWIEDWVTLAKRYKQKPNVIGADLHNEPHGQASWGTGDKTDWRLAAERAGNAILAVNPNWLIIVEGVERNVAGSTDNYWWGGNLQGVRKYPVRLNVPNKVVYSTHDYGSGVYHQSWFNANNFPENMPAIWDKYWGYIHKEGIAPVLIGEFGGRNVDTTSNEGKWQHALVQYIHANNLYWTYWSLNPNSGDTGGLLLDDWQTWHSAKQSMLAPIMKINDGTFTDVPKKHPYYADIQAIYEAKIITGYADGRFQPSTPIARKHVAAMLSKLDLPFTPVREAYAFADVVKGNTYEQAIQKLYRTGIIDGANGKFNPDGLLTRAQLAKIFVHVFDLQLVEGTEKQFTDVKQSDWYAPYVAVLASNGITTGANGKFMPNDRVTRAHFAAFLHRAMK